MSKSSRIVSNLLQQNCYVRDVTRSVDLKSPSSSDSQYLSLDEEQTDEGFKIKKNLYPYPITPDYVASFADSSDYRRDPANSVVSGVKGKNIGDCTDFQKIMNMDSSDMYALYNQLKTKFSKPVSQTVSDAAVQTDSNAVVQPEK